MMPIDAFYILFDIMQWNILLFWLVQVASVCAMYCSEDAKTGIRCWIVNWDNK